MEESPSIADKLARLAELETDFQRALEAEKLEALAEFAAGAGHEINNPLTVISGRAQLLLREETDPERQHALALISAQAMRVYEMIADMMLFARPPRPEVRPVELVKLIDDLVADFLLRCARQETSIRRTGSPGPIVVAADPAQLNVALRAMCQNAVDALQSGGHIEIEVAEGKGDSPHLPERPFGCSEQMGTVPFSPDPAAREVKISIRDDGPGLKPEERRHVFDPFYSARQAGRGIGLGLCKAWRIITNHGGRIEVVSQPGRGATFIVTLTTAG
jgi:signal transduction histidine kinase